MFCKRCDGAYHCYCQQPPHKVHWISYLCSFAQQAISLCISLVKHVECWPWALLVSETYQVSQLWFFCPWKWPKCAVWIFCTNLYFSVLCVSLKVFLSFVGFLSTIGYCRWNGTLLLIWISTPFLCFGTVSILYYVLLCISGKLDVGYLVDWWIGVFHE